MICGGVEQEEVLVTGTDLINVTVLVFLLGLSFSIKAILLGSAITLKGLGLFSVCNVISVEVFTIQVAISTNVSVQRRLSLLYFTKMYIFDQVAT